MFFWSIKKKTVKELRKNKSMTARDLAQKLKLDTAAILKIDDMRLGDVPEPIHSLITPVLTNDETDKMPWL